MGDGDLKGPKLAPFNPSSPEVIAQAIELLQLGDGDVVYDLGCGDARFLVEAVRQPGVSHGVGVEYDVKFFSRATELVRAQGLEGRIRLLHGNALQVPLQEATAIFVYLLPQGLAALKEELVAALQRRVRIVSHVFSIPGLEPMRTETFKSVKTRLYTEDSIRPSPQEGETGAFGA